MVILRDVFRRWRSCNVARPIVMALLFLLALLSIRHIQEILKENERQRLHLRIVAANNGGSHVPPPLSVPTNAPTDSNIMNDATSASPLLETTASTVYFFPKEPLFQATVMVKEAIGSKILKDPQKNPLRNCSVTVQFRLILPPQSHSSSWILQSLRQNGTNDDTVPKTQGGDEIYVEWQSTAGDDIGVAQVTDQNDGTYALTFVRPPILQKNHSATTSSTNEAEDFGNLTIYYDYSCGIGGILAPRKNQYARAGEIQTVFSHEQVPRPYIHDFVPPNQDGTIDFSKYETVIAFGDSLMLQLVRRYKLGGFWSPNIIYFSNVGQCLSDPVQDVNTLLEKFHTWHGEHLRQAANRSERVAVIAGSAVWDAMRGCVRRDFRNHSAAVRSFVTTIRQTYHSSMDLFWKSPSAVQLHRRSSLKELLNNPEWLQRSRYMGDTIPRRIYAVQKALMRELKIPLLDLWDAYYLSGPFTIPGDSRHYQDDVSFLLMSYFWPGLEPGKVYYQEQH